ncbi:MAG TPA: glycosyltransferase [Membranihabitans sp.]|nr:glycosyltransferase [Membranihabitans sp.]
MDFTKEKPTDILYVAKNIPTPTLPANRVIFTLAEYLHKFHQIDFIYPKEWVPFFLRKAEKYQHLVEMSDWNYKDMQVQVLKYIRLPLPQFALILTRPWLSLPEMQRPYKFIHAHYVMPDAYISYLLSVKWGIPFGITVRNSDVLLLNHVRKNSHTWKMLIHALQNAAFLTCLNDATQKQIHAWTGRDARIIPHGIEKDFILQQPPEYGETLNLISVGSLIHTKQVDWVVKAFQKIKTRYRVSLTIVGSGPEERTLKKLAQGDPNIHFTGKIPKTKVIELLTKSQIFLLPSKSETYGLVYNEAAARHNAIIGYKDQGPCGTFIEDKEMLFTNHFEDFCQKLEILVNNESLRNALAYQALMKVRQLKWEKIAQQYHELYSNHFQ